MSERPHVNDWSVGDVQEWLAVAGLLEQDGTAEAFMRNHVDGKRLLVLAEDELKSRSFGIQRLGRRKNIIRAVNLLKANICRSVNNGTSMLQSDHEFAVNRSAGTIRPNLNRSNFGLGSIDRSTILSNAQSFFKNKGAHSSSRQTRPNRFTYVGTNTSSLNSSNGGGGFGKSFTLTTPKRAGTRRGPGAAKSYYDGNLSFI